MGFLRCVGAWKQRVQAPLSRGNIKGGMMRLLRWGIVLSGLFTGFSAAGLTLESVYKAADHRRLPTRMFQEIQKYRGFSAIKIFKGDWPRYYPYYNQIELPARYFEKVPSEWGIDQWPNFYNELFHAWWDEVFLRESSYATTRKKLRTFLPNYVSAGNPELCQEEALSETTGAVILLLANNVAMDQLQYRIGWSIEAVNHDDNPKFGSAASSTYPSKEEYGLLLGWLLGKDAEKIKLGPTDGNQVAAAGS